MKASPDEKLIEAIRWIRMIADFHYEYDTKLRSNGARTLKRIADKCDKILKEYGK